MTWDYKTAVCLIILTGLQRVARAGPVGGFHKRYYHHEVHLEPSNHNDEFFNFVTRPDLDAPRWSIDIFDEGAITPGYWFAAPYSNLAQSTADAPWNAPHIYDTNGDLVWSGAPFFDGFTTFDFRVNSIQGKAMLSLVYPRGGKAYIFDDAYRIHKIIDMGDEILRENHVGLNSHEFVTTANGTRALFMNRLPRLTAKKNIEAVGWDDKCFAVFDGIQELDTQTWESTHQWNSEGRIGLDESYANRGSIQDRCAGSEAWDFFHANSIDMFSNGDYLLSGRRTNAVYRISRATGSIVWRLGGRKSDFVMPVAFSGQHAAKIHEDADSRIVISLLDNAFLPPSNPQATHHESRGLLLEIDTIAMTVRVLSEFPHPEGRYAMSRGNMHMLPNNNAWICWADGSLQSEHTINGSLIMKARFKAGISSYRTYKLPWIGRPDYPPDVHAAIVDKNGQWYTIVHMSWNGATEVYEWNVYQTDSRGGEKKLKTTIPKRGFETSAWTGGYAAHVVVEALNKDGQVLGKSNVFTSLAPQNHSQSVMHTGSMIRPPPTSSGDFTPTLMCGIAIGMVISAVVGLFLTRHRVFKYFQDVTRQKKVMAAYHRLTVRRYRESDDLERFAYDPAEDKGRPQSGNSSQVLLIA